MGLISIDDLEIYLQESLGENPSFTTTEIELYEFLIEAVSEQAEIIMGRTIEENDYISRVDGNGTNDLILENPPITGLTSANYIDIQGNLTEIDTDFVVIDYNNGILYKNTIWIKGRHNVQISYSAGYAETPDGLKVIICEMVVDAFNSVETGAGIIEEELGDYSYKLASATAKKEQFISKLSLYTLQDNF